MNSDTNDGMVLRTGTAGDAAAAAALHAGQIGEGFLAILGPSFLHRLYRRVARTPGSFLLVVEDGRPRLGSSPARPTWRASIGPSSCVTVQLLRSPAVAASFGPGAGS